MGFRVEEGALDDAAAHLMPLVGDVATARSYTARHVSLAGGYADSGIFVTAIGVLREIASAMDDQLAHLRSLTLASAAELRDTADSYRTTDDATDARMDRTYTPAARPPGRQMPL